jgi:hypothetical protein
MEYYREFLTLVAVMAGHIKYDDKVNPAAAEPQLFERLDPSSCG